MSDLFASSSEAEAPEGGSPAYRVLARKYRPSTFEELIGQEAMVRTLSNAIESGRLPHAWMLTGVRGIGKTTTARIVARALNCTGPDGQGGPTIHPCGVCEACRSIAEDRHVDVQELDAASRTSVDDIRDIIDGVRYGPVSARYKIYILDEVHMLSKNAFNALLKTLEEPPPHTKFIFATTEIRKVPVTVLSRCQRFDLRRIDAAMLADHFAKLAVKEKVEAEAEAIKLIARAADGSVRDGLSLLDQAIARGGEKITEADVKDMLGLADRSRTLDLCRDVLLGHMREALEGYASILSLGADPLQVLQDIAELIHLLTRFKIVPESAASPDVPEIERKLSESLTEVKLPALARAWQILLKGLAEVQTAPRPADAAEMVLIRLAYASDLPSPDELIRQLREKTQMETSLGGSAGSSPSPGGGARAMGGSGNVVALPSVSVRRAEPASFAIPAALPVAASACMPSGFRELVALFGEKREATLYSLLYDEVHVVRCEPGLLEVHLRPGVPQGFLPKVAQALTQWTGRRWMVSVVETEGAPTLAEEEKAVEAARQAKAQAHPVYQAVLKNFPEAKLVALRDKKTVSAEVEETSDLPEMEDSLQPDFEEP